MVASSIIFFCTYFVKETLTEVSTKTQNDPNNHSTIHAQIPIDQEQPVVLVKHNRSKIVTTVKHINKT